MMISTPELALRVPPLVRKARAGQRTWRGSVRSVRVCEPSPGVAEVTAVVELGSRVGALAVRMEYGGGQWWLTTLEFA
jgi:hypothetical protein